MPFNINHYEQNVLISTIVGIDKDAVHDSIPNNIFHTRGWVIQSSAETIAKLSDLSGNQTWQLGVNPFTQSRLIVCESNPDEVSIIMPKQQQQQQQTRRYSKVPILPPSDDEDEVNPPQAILCLDRAYRTVRKKIIYFIRTYIVSVNQ